MPERIEIGHALDGSVLYDVCSGQLLSDNVAKVCFRCSTQRPSFAWLLDGRDRCVIGVNEHLE